jgi:predicted dinucleotide-binding enzyme
MDCAVLVVGDQPKDGDLVIGLARAIGLRSLHAGALANSAAAGAPIAVLIGADRTYKGDGAVCGSRESSSGDEEVRCTGRSGAAAHHEC